MAERLQSNLSRGELSPDMHVRIDSQIYHAGLDKAENVVILPHGGIRRRPGLTTITDSLIPVNGRLLSFEFSVSQDYLIVLLDEELSVYRDGVVQATIPTIFTIDEIKDIDVAQGGDVMILTHPDKHPQMLRREGSHTAWVIQNTPLTNIPTYDFGVGAEPVWSADRGWPAVCTFFQQRLWMAGSTYKPNSVWASKINSYYDFDIGTGQEDYAIFDTIDTDQFNQIVNIFPGRVLHVFTRGSEYYNSADYITSTTSTWKRTSGYGSKRLRPLLLEGEVVFIDRIGVTVRSAVFSLQENSFVAPSISLISNHLIKNALSIDAVQGTNIDVSDFLYVVNEDGTVGVMNSIKAENLVGWTHWTTQGEFKDVCTVNKIVYFLVERHGEFHIEYINEGTTLDHNTVYAGAPLEQPNVVHNLTSVSFNGDSVVHTLPGSGAPIDTIDTGETPTQAAKWHELLLDNAVQDPIKGGVVTLPREAYRVEIGFPVPLLVRTMPLNTTTKDGSVTINKEKRVIKIILNLVDTLGVRGNKSIFPDKKFKVTLDEITPYTGMKEIYLLGYENVTQIELTQEHSLPFRLLGFGHEVS